MFYLPQCPQPYVGKVGAGEGNRTLVISLEGNEIPYGFNPLVDMFRFRTPFDIVQEIDLVHHRFLDRTLVGKSTPRSSLP
jgi:hypothetical protein